MVSRCPEKTSMLFFKAIDVFEADARLAKKWANLTVVGADYASPPARYHHKFLN